MGKLGGKLTDEEKARLQEKIESAKTERPRGQKVLTRGMKLVLLMLLDCFIWIFAIVRFYSGRYILPLDALILLTILITVGGIIYIRRSSKEEE